MELTRCSPLRITSAFGSRSLFLKRAREHKLLVFVWDNKYSIDTFRYRLASASPHIL